MDYYIFITYIIYIYSNIKFKYYENMLHIDIDCFLKYDK